jgi:hypothetical protein
MLYRRSKAAEIKRRLRSGESGSHMSQIAGAMWATESAAVKAYWDGQAKAETAAHKLLHPDYSYKPGAGRATKRKAARGARTSTRRRTTPKIEVPKLEPEVEAQLFVFSPSPSPLLLPTPLPFMADEGDRVELPSPCVTALSAHEPTTSTRSDAPAVPTLGTLLDWRLALDAVSNTERLVFPPCLLMTPDVLSSAQVSFVLSYHTPSSGLMILPSATCSIWTSLQLRRLVTLTSTPTMASSPHSTAFRHSTRRTSSRPSRITPSRLRYRRWRHAMCGTALTSCRVSYETCVSEVFCVHGLAWRWVCSCN